MLRAACRTCLRCRQQPYSGADCYRSRLADASMTLCRAEHSVCQRSPYTRPKADILCRPFAARLLRSRGTHVRQRRHVARAAEDAELELAVFRFTLGIPGFDDAYIPRVAGAGGLLLLALNHYLSPGPAPDAQAISEVLAACLAAVCIASPTIEARLKELEPGRGRQAAQQIQGAARVFTMADELSLKQKQELAWASYALLCNTNTCSVLALVGEQAVLARGAVAAPANQADAGKASLEKLYSAKDGLSRLLSSSSADRAVYLPDRGAITSANTADWLPTGIESMLIHQSKSTNGDDKDVVLVLLSERSRAWSSRERLWGAAIAKKLQGYW